MDDNKNRQAIYDILHGMRLAPRHQLEEAAERVSTYLASQSQAAQPSDTTDEATKWAETFYRNADTFTFRDLGIVQAAWAEATRRAHLAGQSQATKVQAVPIYQGMCGDFGGYWEDVSKEDFDADMDRGRKMRIVYSAPTAQEVTQQAAPEAPTAPYCYAGENSEGQIRLHTKVKPLGTAPDYKVVPLYTHPPTQQAAKAETAEQAEGAKDSFAPPFAAPASQHKANTDGEIGLSSLRAVAEAAAAIAPGSWTVEGPDCSSTHNPDVNISQDEEYAGCDMRINVRRIAPRKLKIGGPAWLKEESKCLDLAEFVAAFSPGVVLALIDQAEQSSTAGAAKGGEDKPNGSDLAPTTSTATASGSAQPEKPKAVLDIRAAVNRFLGWKLPKDFSPDSGISFTAYANPLLWPIGTNLLNDDQAKEMFEHCLKDAVRPTDDHLWNETLRDRDTYHEWADKLADAIAKHFGADIGEHSNMNCPWHEALEVIDSASAQASQAAASEAVNEGLEMAARHLDKQRQAVDQDHAYQEPDTGAWVFDRPETEEYSNTLAELADEIRALKRTNPATPASKPNDEQKGGA